MHSHFKPQRFALTSRTMLSSPSLSCRIMTASSGQLAGVRRTVRVTWSAPGQKPSAQEPSDHKRRTQRQRGLTTRWKKETEVALRWSEIGRWAAVPMNPPHLKRWPWVISHPGCYITGMLCPRWQVPKLLLYGTRKHGALPNYRELFFLFRLLLGLPRQLGFFGFRNHWILIRLGSSYDVFGLCDQREEDNRAKMIILKHAAACRVITF